MTDICQKGAFSREDSPFSKKTKPFTKKTSPYSTKTKPFTRKDSPFSKSLKVSSLIDSCIINDDQDGILAGQYYAQSFIATTKNIDSCKFYLRWNISAIIGSAVAYLYAHTGTYGINGKPTSSPLATSDSFDLSTVTSSHFTYKTFTFSGINKYLMTAGTHYCIAIKVVSISGGMLRVGLNNAPPTHSGNSSYSTDGTNWISQSPDLNFYVYGTFARFARKTSPFSKKTDPFSRKSSPFSKKAAPFSRKDALFSKQIICPFLLQETGWPIYTEAREKIRL